MGTKEMIVAFNSVSGADAQCQRATLGYNHEHDVESQILTFYGTWSDGTPFTSVTGKLPAAADVAQASRVAAQSLLAQRTHPP